MKVTFTGKALWSQVWPEQIDREFEDPSNGRGGNWSIKVIVDDDNLKKFNALGAKAKAKRIEDLKNTDGLEDYLDSKFLTFRRYEYANYGKGPEPLGSPTVTGVEDGTSIGNGSDITVTVDAYPYEFKGKPSVAIRLLSVHVDNLVEYVRPSALEASETSAPPVH